MNKPIVVARQEFVDESVSLVNKYGQEGLPMFVMADILESVLAKVREEAQKQYSLAKERYDKECRANEEKREAKS